MPAPHAQEKCITGAKARGRFRKSRNLLIYVRWRFERAFFRSRCQRGTAVFAVACPFCGTQEKCGARESASELSGVKVQCDIRRGALAKLNHLLRDHRTAEAFLFLSSVSSHAAVFRKER